MTPTGQQTALDVTTPDVNGLTGAFTEATVAGVGGDADYSFALVRPATGLSISGTTVMLDPRAEAATVDYTVRVTDGTGATADSTGTFTIAANAVLRGAAPVRTIIANSPAQQSRIVSSGATGGTAPYTYGLPPQSQLDVVSEPPGDWLGGHPVRGASKLLLSPRPTRVPRTIGPWTFESCDARQRRTVSSLTVVRFTGPEGPVAFIRTLTPAPPLNGWYNNAPLISPEVTPGSGIVYVPTAGQAATCQVVYGGVGNPATAPFSYALYAPETDAGISVSNAGVVTLAAASATAGRHFFTVDATDSASPPRTSRCSGVFIVGEAAPLEAYWHGRQLIVRGGTGFYEYDQLRIGLRPDLYNVTLSTTDRGTLVGLPNQPAFSSSDTLSVRVRDAAGTVLRTVRRPWLTEQERFLLHAQNVDGVTGVQTTTSSTYGTGATLLNPSPGLSIVGQRVVFAAQSSPVTQAYVVMTRNTRGTTGYARGLFTIRAAP